MSKVVLDAKGKKLGRVASEAAKILLGKSSADFQRNKVAPVSVEIINASKLVLSEKKLSAKKYVSFSGYPGGFKETSLKGLINKRGFGEVLKRAVRRMLPANKLRTLRIKRLFVIE